MTSARAVAFDRKFGRRFYRLHMRLYRLTGGLIGHRSNVGPMLLLTTTGRKSGLERTTPLLYMPDGENYLVVGSNGGRDEAPNWLRNIETDPLAAIQVGRKKVSVSADILIGPTKDELWPRLLEYYEGWGYYEHLTERVIPVVRLRVVGLS